jgi:hypothetical protein
VPRLIHEISAWKGSPRATKSRAFRSLVTLVASNGTGLVDVVLLVFGAVGLVVRHFRTSLQWFFVRKGRILKRHYAVLDVSKVAIAASSDCFGGAFRQS